LVVRSRERFVSRSVTWTEAFWREAPAWSVTLPRMVPRLVPCANAEDVPQRMQARRRRLERKLRIFFIQDSMGEGVSVWQATYVPVRAF
jgi:hypothetical protein